MLKLYLSLIPSGWPFYRRSSGDHPPRYSAHAIGVHKLETTVKRFCTKAGFVGNYTNHSGKVTCATELFKHNVDEQLIMAQTGHRSHDAVHMYKHPTEQHQQQVSDILHPPAKRSNVLQHQEQTGTNTRPSNTRSAISDGTSFNISTSGRGTQNIYICCKEVVSSSYRSSALNSYYYLDLCIIIITLYYTITVFIHLISRPHVILCRRVYVQSTEL